MEQKEINKKMVFYETLDKDVKDAICLYIDHIRKMSIFTDQQLQELLAKQAIEDPEILEKLKIGKQKQELNKLIKESNDINRHVNKIARKVA